MIALKQATHSDIQKMFDEALGHHQAGRIEDAEKIYRQILLVAPQHADSLHLLGMVGYRKDRLDDAVALIRQAIAVQNNVPLYYSNLANVLKAQGKLDEAVEHYTRALTLNPDFAEAHYNLATVLQDQGKLKEAITHYERALTLQPRLTAAHINLGNAVKEMGRLDDAIKHYERALALDPGNAEAHYNLGTALKDQDKFSEALTHYERALALKPDYADAHNNLGVLLQDRGQFEKAIRHFQKTNELRPEHVESHVNEAMALLQAGKMAEGWKKYEWRWRMKGVKPLKAGKPLWDGGDLKGKTILLHGEQGLGDCLQFVRYASMVKERGGRIVLMCPPALSRLFETVSAVDQIVPEGASLPDYDCHAPLLSLPMLFGTTLETIPNSVPYLYPSADQVAVWAERLKAVTDLKVGLVWAGNSRPDHPNAQAVDRRRSIHIGQLTPLAGMSGVQLFSLQKGDPARQLAALPPGLSVIDHMDHVQDFADTAAFIANLDLVIGVDTSVVHLAGALGKPVWVLSRFDGCWRWLLNREDSPWYPTLRLFRQAHAGDWGPVIEDVRAALEAL